MSNLKRQIMFSGLVLAAFLTPAGATAKTVYVHLINGDDRTGDGTYSRPYKSWRTALTHVGSGDTIIAKNGDYRAAGPQARWGGLDLILTMADQLDQNDPRQPVIPPARPDTVGIYRYDPEHPLVIRAETKQGVIIDHIRFHMARGIVIDGFEIIPNPYYTDDAGNKLNRRRNGIHGDSVYEPEDSYNRVQTNDPPGGYTAVWYDRKLWTSYITVRNCKIHYPCPPQGCTPAYDPLQDDDRLYLIKFNQSHHITIEDCELFDGKNFQRKPAIDLPCCDDVIVRRNLISNSHRGVVSKGGGKRVLIEANVFLDNSGAAFSGGSTDPNLFIDGRYGDPCSFAKFESYDMTARNNLVLSTRPGERPVEPIATWAAKNANIENNTFIGIGERGVLVVRPGNEVDSPGKNCGQSVRLVRTENLTLRNNIFILSGVVDETMLYQVAGQGVNVNGFVHSSNTFFNSGREVPGGGLADPNLEAGFSKADPLLTGGQGTDYVSWMNVAKLKINSPSRGRGIEANSLAIPSQEATRPTYEVARTRVPIKVDGRLEETAWARVPALRNFLNNADGSPSRLITEAKILYDDNFLYFSFRCVDDNIWATMKRRDQHLWLEEVVEFFVQADENKPSYIEVEVNPLGTILDLYMLDVRKPLHYESWNSEKLQWAVQVEGTVDGKGGDKEWTCEIALPLEDVVTAPHSPPQAGDRWRLNLYRVEQKPASSELAWSPTLQNDFHVPKRFGEIVFTARQVP